MAKNLEEEAVAHAAVADVMGKGVKQRPRLSIACLQYTVCIITMYVSTYILCCNIIYHYVSIDMYI